MGHGERSARRPFGALADVVVITLGRSVATTDGALP